MRSLPCRGRANRNTAAHEQKLPVILLYEVLSRSNEIIIQGLWLKLELDDITHVKSS